MDGIKIPCILTHENSMIPTKGTPESAGYDVYSTCSGIIRAGKREKINLGIILEIPQGFFIKIEPRSGLANKYGIIILAGIIDSDYRNEIQCILYNSGDEDYHFNVRDRIAQIIMYKNYNYEYIETNKINTTQRKGGFGSTGN